MKKYIGALILLFAVTTPAFALGPVDAMICKRVVLHAAHNRTVLVERVTGEVKYALQHDGKWMPLQGEQKKRYQSMYDAQVHPQKR